MQVTGFFHALLIIESYWKPTLLTRLMVVVSYQSGLETGTIAIVTVHDCHILKWDGLKNDLNLFESHWSSTEMNVNL